MEGQRNPVTSYWFVQYSAWGFCTCHHERADALHAALHGGFHQGGEAVAVPSLDVQAGVVVEQVVGDCYVALEGQKRREQL